MPLFRNLSRQRFGDQTGVPLPRMVLFSLQHSQVPERVFDNPSNHLVATFQENSIPPIRVYVTSQVLLGL